MTGPTVLGLDLSLTSTGYATNHTTGTIAHRKKRKGEVSEGYDLERLLALRQHLTTLIKVYRPDLAVIEDYAYSAAKAHAHKLGEWGGIARLTLTDAGIPWVAVIPSSLKKYATGTGNAGKPEMLVAAIRRLGFDGHDDNEVDALWLAAMGLDHLGHPLADLPAAQRQAMDKVAWPTLEQPPAAA